MFHTITLVIPAYNEEHRIAVALEEYAAFFSEWQKTVPNLAGMNILVVVNGTTDNTVSVVESVQKKYSSMISMHVVPEKIGKGGAVYEGWKRAYGNIVGFVDADGATSPAEMGKLMEYLIAHDDVDGVIASRYIGGSTVNKRTSKLRAIASRCYIFFIQYLFWLPFQDMQCGAKVFRKSVITELLPNLHRGGMEFDVELLWKLHRNGKRIVELPTIWIDQPGSATLEQKHKFISAGLGMLWRLLKLRILGR